MKVHTHTKVKIQGRPDYYITPTRDFTQYTRDSEQKYWTKDTKFDWHQNVKDNLKEHLDNLDVAQFIKIFFLVLPMVADSVQQRLVQIRQYHLPLDEDALKDIAECIPFDKATIQRAILVHSPLKSFELAKAGLEDQLEILQSELLDLRDQIRLGFYKKGTYVKAIETNQEADEQNLELSGLTSKKDQLENNLRQLKAQNKIESDKLRTKIGKELLSIEPLILTDLEETFDLVTRTITSCIIPSDAKDLALLKDLVLKRQLRGLKDIANHALVVEQSAIAPLTMGIIHYKRYREIQEAMTTFIGDEAKHSATFRRYLVEKLEAKEFISAKLIKGSTRYMWLARFMPGAGLFMAVIVEAIGAAYLEFFAKKEYMPEKLFRSISTTISEQDEVRHMDLCAAMYNELFRTGQRWERMRNMIALKFLLKSVYGDRNEDHHLIQAFRAFGVESGSLYKHIAERMSVQLARVSVYVAPQKLLDIIGIARR